MSTISILNTVLSIVYYNCTIRQKLLCTMQQSAVRKRDINLNITFISTKLHKTICTDIRVNKYILNMPNYESGCTTIQPTNQPTKQPSEVK